MHPRPTTSELTSRLARARDLLLSRPPSYFDANELQKDLTELDCYTPEEISSGIHSAFHEVSANDYVGHNPPQTGRSPSIAGSDLFEFVWASIHFNQKMYLKFCIRRRNSHEELILCSLHKDAPERKKRGGNK